MDKYRKGIVAGVGALVLILGRHFGIESDIYFDAVCIATAFGVYQVPNAPMPSPKYTRMQREKSPRSPRTKKLPS